MPLTDVADRNAKPAAKAVRIFDRESDMRMALDTDVWWPHSAASAAPRVNC